MPEIKTDKTFMEDREVFCCPLCGDHFVHPYEVTSWKADPNRNELSFSVKCECEGCLKQYDIIFDFHEGNTFVNYENIENIEER